MAGLENGVNSKEIPKSKAKTAYGLLSEIRKIILEEPKRYDQWGWLRRGKSLRGDPFEPACGTVGCVGGWITVLKDAKSDDAIQILGVGIEAAWELFDADAAGKRMCGDGFEYSEASICAHAKRGARHIERFQKKYAKQLKAKRV